MPSCAGTASGSVFASSMTRPERQPFVTHIFWPVSTNSSPSRTAAVRIDWTSEPACGSVIENAARTSPVARRGSHACRCSSVPWLRSIQEAMKLPFMIPGSVTQPRESSIRINA